MLDIADTLSNSATPTPRARRSDFGAVKARTHAVIQAVDDFIAREGRPPSTGRLAPEAERLLAGRLLDFRTRHPALAEEHRLTTEAIVAATAQTGPRYLRAVSQAQAVGAFVTKHGRNPLNGAPDPDEHRLGSTAARLRTSHPELAERFGFMSTKVPKPAREPKKRGTPAHTFAQRLIIMVRNGDLRYASDITDRMAPEPLACQVKTRAHVIAEIEANCWWFTLEGQNYPDPRQWHELRMSGDHALIVKATRVAYLDFEAQHEPGPCKKAPRRVY